MATAIQKTISLPPDLTRAVERIARDDRRHSARSFRPLFTARPPRLRDHLATLQGHWSRRARERGILTEEDQTTGVAAMLCCP